LIRRYIVALGGSLDVLRVILGDSLIAFFSSLPFFFYILLLDQETAVSSETAHE